MITNLKKGDLIYSRLTEYTGIVVDITEESYLIFWPQSKLGTGIVNHGMYQLEFLSEYWTVLVHSNL